MARMTDAELIAAIDAEAAVALDSNTGQLAGDRATALARFKGEGPEAPEGRSSVVSRDLSDTIEWIVPSLARIFLGGTEIGKFEPIGPEDEKAAEIETDCINWMLEAKNDAYTQIITTLKDALLLRTGYLLASWRSEYTVITETYTGLADEEAAILLEDDEIKIVEHREYAPDNEANDYAPGAKDADEMPAGIVPPMDVAGANPVATLHDIKLERKRPEEYVAVESIPPDEVLVSRRHRWTSLTDCDFVQWRRRATIGELRAQGYDVPDDAPGDDDLSADWATRDRFGETTNVNDETPDPARRVVTVHETWIRIDLRGTGKQQLWRVCHLAGASKPLVKEEADVIPVAAFTGIIYPHSHIGISIDDVVSDLSDIKTILMRQGLDNVYLANNTQTVVDVNRVNLDDWLTSRPGGIKRVEGPVGDAYAQLVNPDVSGNILGMLEYVDQVKEARTGVTRYSAGLDANSLNKTATGVTQIQAAANQRIELIARTMATGFRDLFCIMHTLLSKHSTRPLQVRLNGEWMAIDPRSWTKRTDFSISVGLGTGTPEQQMSKLQMMFPFMMQGAQIGLVGPDEFYNWASEMTKAAGYKNPDKFVKEPERGPDGKALPVPPQPNPMVQAEQAKGQVQLQIAQLKAQHEAQIAQLKAQTDQAKEAAQMQADMEVQKQKIQTEAELAAAKAKMQVELDALRHSKEQETALQLENIRQAGHIEIARINAGISDGQLMVEQAARQAGYDAVVQAESVKVLLEAVNAPHEAMRGPDGKIIGVRRVMNGSKEGLQTPEAQQLYDQMQAPREAVRGPDGKIVGTRTRH